MEVILSKDVDKLGKAGQIVRVKNGYARNYLLPQKIAFPATDNNVRRVEQLAAKKEVQMKEERDKAQELAEQMSKLSLTISVEVNDLDKLYGSVTEQDIVRALEAEGVTVDKNDILLDRTIGELGIYEVRIRTHPEVEAKIRLWVTKK